LISDVSNIGSIAHAALELWIGNSDWLTDGHGERLRELYSCEGARRGVSVNNVSGGRLLGVHLKHLAGQLREVLRGSDPSNVHVESSLADESRRIWGVPDLQVVDNKCLRIYDFKTGQQAFDGQEVADSVLVQLAVYEMLGALHYPLLEVQSFVISPKRGVVAVGDLGDVKDRICQRIGVYRELVAAHRKPPASPAVEACRFCPRRPRCEPHWLSDVDELSQDRIEGRIADVRVDRSGRISFAAKTPNGMTWVLGVNSSAITGLDWAVGRQLRAVRLVRTRLDGDETVHFRATSQSAVFCF
jgi:hypothetical protein